MKRILVPTDFSANALQALDHAIQLANQFKSHVILLTTFETPHPTGSFRSMQEVLRKDAEEQMDQLVRKSRKKLVSGSSIEGRVVEGRTIDLITNATEYYNVDLVVMGTKGASGLKEIFIGSNTSGVIQRTKIPLLAIPASDGFRPINNIVLAIDAVKFDNPDVLEPLVRVAESYNAKLNVFHLERELVPAGFDTDVLSYLDKIPYEFHQSTQSDNINDSINAFVKEVDADLLCMVRRQRGKLKEVFHSSVTRKEVFNSPVPLLVLQDRF